MKKPYKALLISVVITCLVAAVIFILFYRNPGGMGKAFDVTVVYMLIRTVAFYGGLIILLIRAIKLVHNNSVLYVFAGVLNLTVGLLAVLLYFLHLANLPWLNKCLMNILIGFIMMADSFILFRIPEKE